MSEATYAAARFKRPLLFVLNRVTCATAIGLLVGCDSPGGALKVSDPLSEVGMEMNRTGAAERTWAYRHENSVPYWIVVAPGGTSADQIDALGLPETLVAGAKDCVQSGEPALFLAESARSSCVRPLISPEVHQLHAVHKNASEETVFTLRNGESGSWLASVR